MCAKQEARCLLRCRKAGLRVPCPYFVDEARSTLYLERVAGRPVRAVLNDPAEPAAGLVSACGLFYSYSARELRTLPSTERARLPRVCRVCAVCVPCVCVCACE